MSASVSVVIPLYNKIRHVQRAIESVLAQSVGDFELIIVDDGSTDGSREIASRCTDPRIRLLTQANAGVSAARNAGVDAASCEIVAFLDADDQWLPGFLETVMDLRKRFPHARAWATSYLIVDSRGRPIVPDFPGMPSANSAGGLIDFFRCLGPWMPVHPSAVMLQKDALTKAGGFPADIRCGEDRDTWIRFSLRYPVAWSPKAEAVLYQDAENRTDDACWTGVAPYCRRLRDYLQEAGPAAEAPRHVRRYIAQAQMRTIKGNWLAGQRTAMHEILLGCRSIGQFGLTCLKWQCLSYMPHWLVLGAWKLRQRLAGRSAGLPQFRDIHRQASA